MKPLSARDVDPDMRLGAISKQFGLSRDMLHELERHGLLSPARDSSRCRVYGQRDLPNLRLARRFARWGFKMPQIYALFGANRVRALSTKDKCVRYLAKVAVIETELGLLLLDAKTV